MRVIKSFAPCPTCTGIQLSEGEGGEQDGAGAGMHMRKEHAAAGSSGAKLGRVPCLVPLTDSTSHHSDSLQKAMQLMRSVTSQRAGRQRVIQAEGLLLKQEIIEGGGPCSVTATGCVATASKDRDRDTTRGRLDQLPNSERGDA